MADYTLSILKPSVNNLTTRIFVRAAGLDCEEVDVWGKKSTLEFLAKGPADLTPLLEHEGLPKGALWESCAIMQYLCNKHGLERFYPTDPGERAMTDSAMFYLVGTLYPLLARATYPSLQFGQYPGEVGSSEADEALKARSQQDADAAIAVPLEVYRSVFRSPRPFIRLAPPPPPASRFSTPPTALRGLRRVLCIPPLASPGRCPGLPRTGWREAARTRPPHAQRRCRALSGRPAGCRRQVAPEGRARGRLRAGPPAPAPRARPS